MLDGDTVGLGEPLGVELGEFDGVPLGVPDGDAVGLGEPLGVADADGIGVGSTVSIENSIGFVIVSLYLAAIWHPRYLNCESRV